jgi:hypothetical protein
MNDLDTLFPFLTRYLRFVSKPLKQEETQHKHKAKYKKESNQATNESIY